MPVDFGPNFRPVQLAVTKLGTPSTKARNPADYRRRNHSPIDASYGPLRLFVAPRRVTERL